MVEHEGTVLRHVRFSRANADTVLETETPAQPHPHQTPQRKSVIWADRDTAADSTRVNCYCPVKSHKIERVKGWDEKHFLHKTRLTMLLSWPQSTVLPSYFNIVQDICSILYHSGYSGEYSETWSTLSALYRKLQYSLQTQPDLYCPTNYWWETISLSKLFWELTPDVMIIIHNESTLFHMHFFLQFLNFCFYISIDDGFQNWRPMVYIDLITGWSNCW